LSAASPTGMRTLGLLGLPLGGDRFPPVFGLTGWRNLRGLADPLAPHTCSYKLHSQYLLHGFYPATRRPLPASRTTTCTTLTANASPQSQSSFGDWSVASKPVRLVNPARFNRTIPLARVPRLPTGGDHQPSCRKLTYPVQLPRQYQTAIGYRR
jgi:hypothetical protein